MPRSWTASLLLPPLLSAACCLLSCGKDTDMEFGRFVDERTAKIESLERLSSLAYWEAARSGSEEDFRKYAAAQMEIEKIFSDREDFEYIKKTRDSKSLKDPLLKRTADVLYVKYLRNQVDQALLEKMIDLSSKLEKGFNTYRPVIDGAGMSSGDVWKILRTSGDSGLRRKAWEASKGVGRLLEPDLLKLVELRNESAREVGFRDYYEMSLKLGEQDEDELLAVFDELEELTREPFRKLKDEIDEGLAANFSIAAEDIMPWHYIDPYFQEAPARADVDLDRFYEGRDVAQIAADFFASIGMPVEDILSRSDLYEREGKNPHAFCMDVDRSGDIRVLANIEDNSSWMESILHELGHAVYDKYVDSELPYFLRVYPHMCTTEASSMFFGRLAQDPEWMQAALGLDEATVREIAPAVKKSLRAKQLVFARWVQVMFRFERELYRDPGQDLNALWWDLKEKYQLLTRPDGRDEPDYAAKIHIISSPAYYHNYMLGELIASQLHHRIEVLSGTADPAIYGNEEVGKYLRDEVYGPGDRWVWTEHLERATGEPLTARYFAEQFVEEAD